MRLQDKVAIITGAADMEGIGAAVARHFAAEGAKLVLADIVDGSAVVDIIKQSGSDALFVHTDVTSQDSCDALVRAAVDTFGSVDILMNNAARFRGLTGDFMEISTEEWNSVMAVNTAGPFHCIRAVAPVMMEKGRGKIINMASSTIFEGIPSMPHYVASKGAVFALTRTMARTLGAYSITVNSLAPGFTQSGAGKSLEESAGMSIVELQAPMRSIPRPPSVRELLGSALFLACEDSDFMTGQLLLCDGGISFN